MSAVIALLLMQIAPNEGKVYHSTDGFIVATFGGNCLLTTEYESGTKTIIHAQGENNKAYFVFTQENWKPVAEKRYKFKIDFGAYYYDLTANAADDIGFISTIHPEFLDTYAASSKFEILWGTKSIAALKLDGSSKAITAFRLCMKDNGIGLLAPPIKVSIPPKIKSDPFDLSEPAKIAGYYGTSYPVEAKGAEGTVKAAIKVSSSGGALECTIVETSGSTILDEAACKALRQARFNAAKDRAGQPIESFIELPVKYEDPSKTVQPN